jgi:hypothetical protein
MILGTAEMLRIYGLQLKRNQTESAPESFVAPIRKHSARQIMGLINRLSSPDNLLTHNKLASTGGFEPQFRDTGYRLTAAETNFTTANPQVI